MAVVTVLIFTASKLWSTPLEITWQVVLIALPMPIVFGFAFYWMLGIERKPRTSFFKRRVERGRDKELSQDWAYEQATTELENGRPDRAVWARVFADCDGDDKRAKAAYIKRRVERLLAEKATEVSPVFEESEESKQSRANMKRFYVGIASIGVIAIVGLIISSQFFPSEGAKTAAFGQGDEVVGQVPAKDKDGWETIIPAPGTKKWTPQKDAVETTGMPSKKAFIDPDDIAKAKANTGVKTHGVEVDYDPFAAGKKPNIPVNKSRAITFDDIPLQAETNCKDRPSHLVDSRKGNSQLNAAVEASKRGEYEFARRLFLDLANKCNTTAQYNLGVMYENGRGITQNYEEAVKWYSLAMKQGDAEAMSNLGVMYAKGNGVAKDIPESIRLYKLAATMGDAGAQYNLGWVYSKGDGVSKDLSEAIKWLSLSSGQGFAKAQSLLGWMYSAGEGVPKDNLRAHLWLGVSAANGNEFAKKNLAILERRMTDQQITEAQQMQKSCELRKYKDC